MRALSAALVLLAGVALFGIGYVPMRFRGEDNPSVIICFVGMGLGVLGLVSWLLTFFGPGRENTGSLP